MEKDLAFLYCIGRQRQAEVSKVEVSKVTGPIILTAELPPCK